MRFTPIGLARVTTVLLVAASAGCGGGATCPSGQQQCGAVCVDLTRDALHCGACNMACTDGKVCVDSACAVVCPSPLTACSGSCRDLLTDVSNCGKCGSACPQGQVCFNGACAVSCGAGLSNCSGSCRDLQSDSEHCGACGMPCVGGQVCSKGACALTCAKGQTSCGGSCRDLATDPANCGACGTACKPGELCSAGKCQLSCQSGLTNCGGTCRDLTTDPANCGACGNACVMGNLCSMGKCALSCQAGLTDCAGTCRDLLTDVANCGACGKACAQGQVCGMGACAASCANGTTACGNACVNLQTDLANCGRCGGACLNGTVCVAGRCTGACNAPLLTCNNACVDPRFDPANCGACGVSCGMPANGTPACINSACRVLCSASFGDCDGQPGNGCESDLRVDVNNCAACGIKCGAVANGSTSCAAGACKLACNANFNDCNGLYADGCESDQRTDAANCGACGKGCGQGGTCVGGVCTTPASCKALKLSSPNALSGLYTLDPDGAGGVAPLTTFCDMVTDGGGWTLLVNRLTMSDTKGQPDLNTTVAGYDGSRATNFTINVAPFYAAVTDVAYAVKHNGACVNCNIGNYDSGIKAPRSANNAFSITCPAIEAVNATKLVGPSAGQVLTAYRCTGSLGWGSCAGNVCHWGLHGSNASSDGSWSQNTAQELHFPSNYSMYAAYASQGGYCRSCAGALPIPNPASSTCCNSPGSPDNSTWTVWVR